MIIDATFWVAISFLIFIGLLIYLKVPQKVDNALNENIKKIKDDLDNAEKLKDDAKNLLSEYELKVSKSKEEATNDFLENTDDWDHNGMGDSTIEVLKVDVCGTNIERNKEGRIIKSDEITKENREHNKKIGGTIL